MIGRSFGAVPALAGAALFLFSEVFLKPGTPADKMQAVVLQYTKEEFAMNATGFLMKHRNRHIIYELF